MIGQNAQGVVNVAVAAAIRDAVNGLARLDDGLEQVRVIDRLQPVGDDRGALQARAGIDVLLGQQPAHAVFVLVVLHEDEVPELEPTAITVGRILGKTAAEARPLLVVQLTVGTTWTALPGWAPPIVLVAETLDALLGNAGVQPHLVGFVVGLVDGDPQLVLLETEMPG